MKRILYLSSAFLLAGNAFFLSGCFQSAVAEGVQINSIEVGGLSYAEAIERVRKELYGNIQPLTLQTPEGEITLRYPQLGVKDNLSILVRMAHKGNALTAKSERTWAEAQAFLEGFCKRHERAGKNAELIFEDCSFSYLPEQAGVACDYQALFREVSRALSSNQERVTLQTREVTPEVTEKDLRERTQLLSEFTTYFDGGNEPRVNNIRLSASRIAGTVLQSGEEFSFNQTVGLRTAENGYESATVIQNGVFTDGIGGGVCQTSTTLFNAALLAGMEITESRNHSLSISYVPPSLDAMVSEYSDFKFKNPSPQPVYLTAEVEGEGITFRFYGLPSGYTFETESVTLGKIAPPPPQITVGDEEKTVRAEKHGLTSESYRLAYDSAGNLLERTLIRRDEYKTVQGIYQILPE